MLHGKYHGHGKLIKSGYSYIGNWVNGKQHGQGKQTLRDGSKYEGLFWNSQRNGKRIYEDNNYIYNGQWHDGKKYGKGKLQKKKNKQFYQGYWQNDSMKGYGTYESANIGKYEGNFQDGKFHGIGVLITKNGSKYQGQFRDNKFYRGKAVIIHQNGFKQQVAFRGQGIPYRILCKCKNILHGFEVYANNVKCDRCNSKGKIFKGENILSCRSCNIDICKQCQENIITDINKQ